MLEPFLNVLVHETNICGNVLTLNSEDALTSQDLKHLQHLDSGKFWWLWTSSGFVHLWPRFIVTSWLQQHVRSHHPWMWWRNELCSHTMYFSILIALNPSRCTTFCTASVSTSGIRGITIPAPILHGHQMARWDWRHIRLSQWTSTYRPFAWVSTSMARRSGRWIFLSDWDPPI